MKFEQEKTSAMDTVELMAMGVKLVRGEMSREELHSLIGAAQISIIAAEQAGDHAWAEYLTAATKTAYEFDAVFENSARLAMIATVKTALLRGVFRAMQEPADKLGDLIEHGPDAVKTAFDRLFKGTKLAVDCCITAYLQTGLAHSTFVHDLGNVLDAMVHKREVEPWDMSDEDVIRYWALMAMLLENLRKGPKHPGDVGENDARLLTAPDDEVDDADRLFTVLRIANALEHLSEFDYAKLRFLAVKTIFEKKHATPMSAEGFCRSGGHA